MSKKSNPFIKKLRKILHIDSEWDKKVEYLSLAEYIPPNLDEEKFPNTIHYEEKSDWHHKWLREYEGGHTTLELCLALFLSLFSGIGYLAFDEMSDSDRVRKSTRDLLSKSSIVGESIEESITLEDLQRDAYEIYYDRKNLEKTYQEAIKSDPNIDTIKYELKYHIDCECEKCEIVREYEFTPEEMKKIINTCKEIKKQDIKPSLGEGLCVTIPLAYLPVLLTAHKRHTRKRNKYNFLAEKAYYEEVKSL